MKRSTIWLVVAFAGLATGLHAVPLEKYVITGITIVDLGDLGGDESEAHDINTSGTVVGWSMTGVGLKHAFISYPRSGMIDLGASFSPNETEANGVNDEDIATGNYWVPGLSDETHAAYWGSFGVAMSDVLNSSENRQCLYGSQAFAINDARTVAGSIGLYRDLDPNDTSVCILASQAATWANPWLPSLLASLGFWSTAYDINNSGVIVGRDILATHEAARWGAGAWKSVPTPATDLANVHYSSGAAYGVNNLGRIVGYFDHVVATGTPQPTVRKHAFRWDGSSAHSSDLGTLMNNGLSVAHEINDQGFVAGYANKINKLPVPNAFGYVRNAGFIWHPDFGMKALPQLPASQLTDACEAYALNARKSDNGLIQVVGYCAVNGKRRAVRWNVTTARSAPVCPTPAC